ncbi:hypothetical protein LNP25_19255 [Klebsiella variicola subsp. variicola]|nr:hypothetical protein [Klebsiella variicola subsp. variicola]
MSRESVVRQMKIALYGLEPTSKALQIPGLRMNRCGPVMNHGTPASPQEAGVIHCALREAP